MNNAPVEIAAPRRHRGRRNSGVPQRASRRPAPILLGVGATFAGALYIAALGGIRAHVPPAGDESTTLPPAAVGYATLAFYDIVLIFVLGFTAVVASDQQARGRPRREIRVDATLKAPLAVVKDAYADYSRWPRVFPTITGVRLLERRGSTAVLEIDHLEGPVINELTVDKHRIYLWEEKRHYDALFDNEFQSVPEGTKVTVRAHIQLKGAARLLSPLLPAIARRQIRHWQLEPLSRAARTRIRGLSALRS